MTKELTPSPEWIDTMDKLEEAAAWDQRVRRLLARAIDVEDKAIVDAAAILAAGHGVRFVVTVRDGLRVSVHVERIDYDGKGRVE